MQARDDYERGALDALGTLGRKVEELSARGAPARTIIALAHLALSEILEARRMVMNEEDRDVA